MNESIMKYFLPNALQEALARMQKNPDIDRAQQLDMKENRHWLLQRVEFKDSEVPDQILIAVVIGAVDAEASAPDLGAARERLAYLEGLERGYRDYAWWRAGEQFVGSCGTTLETALYSIKAEQAELRTALSIAPPSDQKEQDHV